MKKIDRLVRPAINSEELVRHGRALKILERWPDIVGEGLARRSWPDRFTRGTVWVAVSGSAWAQELRLMKETILARLNEESSSLLFLNLRCGVRELPEVAKLYAEGLVPEAMIVDEPNETTLERDTELSIQEIVQRRLEKRRRDHS